MATRTNDFQDTRARDASPEFPWIEFPQFARWPDCEFGTGDQGRPRFRFSPGRESADAG